MNARSAKIGWGRLACVAVAVCGGLSACATAPKTALKADTADAAPMTAEINALVEANRRYPRWADFPAAPTALPADAEIAGQVAGLGVEADDLARERAALVWTLNDPAGFADAVSARVDSTQIAPVTRLTREMLDAFAADLRERGRAPPPIPRR